MPITPPSSRGASARNTRLSSLFVCWEVHKFLLALHRSQLATSWSAVDIPWRYISSYHYAFKSGEYCVHTQTSQHIKHMFTIHKASSLQEKSVLVWGLSPASPNPTLRGFELGVFIQLLSRGIKHGPFGSRSRSSNTIDGKIGMFIISSLSKPHRKLTSCRQYAL